MSLSNFNTFPGFEEEEAASEKQVTIRKKESSRNSSSHRSSRDREKRKEPRENDRTVKRAKNSTETTVVEKYKPTSGDVFIVDKRPDNDNLLYGKSDKAPAGPRRANFGSSYYSKGTKAKYEEYKKMPEIPWKAWEMADRPKEQTDLLLTTTTDALESIEKGSFMPFAETGEGDKSSSSSIIAMDEQKYVTEIRKRLNLAVQDNPHDIEAWMELVAFQNQLLSERWTLKEYENVRERKVAILDKAILKNPGNSLLAVLRLRILSETQSFDVILKQADQFLEIYPNESAMQLFILEHWQTHHTTLGYMLLRDKYAEFLRRNQRPNMDELSLRLFLRAVCLDYEAGYIERALGLLMCFLQLHKKLPQELHTSSAKDRLDYLEDLWATGVPLIGETEASSQNMPVRPKDSTEDSDPEAVVLFEDIRPFLFFTSNKSYVDIISKYYLLLLGVIVPLQNTNLSIVEDPFIHPPIKYLSENWSRWTVCPLTSDNIFADQNLFKLKRYRNDDKYLDVARSLVMEYAVKEPVYFAILLRLEAEVNLENAQDFAETYLNEKGFMISYWRSYLLMESTFGDVDKAKQVGVTLLRTQCEWDDQLGFLSVLKLLTEILIIERNADAVLHYICAACSGHELSDNVKKVPPVTGTAIMSTKGRLRSYIQSTGKEVKRYHITMDALFLYAWTIALTEIVDKAVECFDDIFDELFTGIPLKPGSLQHQDFFILRSKFLQQYMTLYPTAKRSVARGLIQTASTTFPINTVLLDAFIKQEARHKIDQKLEEFLKKSFSINPSLLYYIYQYHIADTRNDGDALKQRTCENAVISPNCVNSSFMWSLYLMFELSTGKLSSAKQVFYRAISACPFSQGIFSWLKLIDVELYMMAFKQPFKTAFTTQELQDIQELYDF